jgi:cell division protein FtsQ
VSVPLPEPDRAPVEMDPRIEARRAEVQREYGRKRLRVLVIVAVVVVLVVGSYLAIESPFLDVDRIEVVGASHVLPKRVRAAAGVDDGRALLRVDLAAVAKRVEQLPWVERARVKRDLPGTLRIDIDESKPVAYVRTRGMIAVIGRDDRVIAWAREVPAGAIEVTGVRRVPKRGQLLSPVGTARVIAALPPELAPHARSVALRTESVVVLLDVGEVRLGTVSDLEAKFAAAIAVMQASYADSTFDYIDVTVPTSPVSSP